VLDRPTTFRRAAPERSNARFEIVSASPLRSKDFCSLPDRKSSKGSSMPGNNSGIKPEISNASSVFSPRRTTSENASSNAEQELMFAILKQLPVRCSDHRRRGVVRFSRRMRLLADRLDSNYLPFQTIFNVSHRTSYPWDCERATQVEVSFEPQRGQRYFRPCSSAPHQLRDPGEDSQKAISTSYAALSKLRLNL